MVRLEYSSLEEIFVWVSLANFEGFADYFVQYFVVLFEGG